MPEALEPFEFKQCIVIFKSIGKKAKNLHELRNLIGAVSDESIFHHTYQFFLKGHFLEYTNDFAYWAGESLEDRALAEKLSSIDPYAYRVISELRAAILNAINGYLKEFPRPGDVIPGNEFYFNETVTLVFPVGIKAHNLAEFLMAIKYIDSASIYYHFYEARVRLGNERDDFSMWFEKAFAKKRLADRIKTIDPFMHSLEGIKEHIIEEVEEAVRKDMEVVS